MSTFYNTSYQPSSAKVLAKYLDLPQPKDKVQVTYVWIDGLIEPLDGYKIRAKSRTINFIPKSPEELPLWHTGGVEGFTNPKLLEIYLKPIALYNDPFRGGNNKLALCECVTIDGDPFVSNTRRACLEVMNQVKDSHDPWFGLEQEYALMEPTPRLDIKQPLGWPENGFPTSQVYDCLPYYCAVGASKVYGRAVIEAHYRACLYAGVEIHGENAELMASMWEYQVGPCKGITLADDAWMSRYILNRVAEDFNVSVSYDIKPVPVEDWSAAGGHVNFSTSQTRNPNGGMKAIEEAIERLRVNHEKHIGIYDLKGGKDNARRLVGSCAVSDIKTFSWGIGERGASVRVTKEVAKKGYGYLEDRRPASNCDPYVVTKAIVETVCLGK